ncbi:MAG: low molecular weight protein-tyrosine-phosphatase [Croceivirga sp.]
MTKILMVCLGNICRSPLAEGILKSKVDNAKVYVDSAGTAGYHIGSLPDPRSIKVAEKHGIDLTNQRCRKFTHSDFSNFDTIYVMDKNNYYDVMAHARSNEEKAKVKLLLNEVDTHISEVPDPYYGGAEGFEYVFTLLDSACEEIVKNQIDATR